MEEDALVSSLEQPIDVMFLIHKVLSLKAARLERVVRNFELGGGIHP